MDDQNQYRILLPDHRLSHDTFRIPLQQPSNVYSGCVLVVNDDDGTQLTVHRSRLFPISLAEPKRACLKCGRVLGVVQDQVECLYGEGDSCELLEPHDGLQCDRPGAEHPQ